MIPGQFSPKIEDDSIYTLFGKTTRTKTQMAGRLIEVYEPRQLWLGARRYTRNERGNREGKYEAWHEGGKPEALGSYRDGKEHGPWTRWFENGNKKEQGEYRDGTKVGRWTRWHENGIRCDEGEFRDGKEHGPWTTWHENKETSRSGSYRDGKMEGQWSWYNGSGRKTLTVTYKDGREHGLQTCWFDNGTKSEEGTYHEGILQGLCHRWNRQGTLISLIEYKDNRPQKVVSLVDHNRRENVLPDGEIQVWKACKAGGRYVYVRLRIPADAARVTPNTLDGTYKSRVEYGVVTEIVDDKGKSYDEAVSCIYMGVPLVYRVGREVRPDGFDPDPSVNCGQGIHVQRYRDQCYQWFLR